MIKDIIIPVIDTENGQFSYDGKIDDSTYTKMLYNRVYESGKNVEYFLNTDVSERGFFQNQKERIRQGLVEYKYYRAEALLLDSKKNEINDNFFLLMHNNSKMFPMVININPNFDMDAQSEIAYWVNDSNGILKDNKLDTKTKLRSLPSLNLYVEIDGQMMELSECKILENYSNEKFPYFYAILVNKINKTDKNIVTNE